MTAFLEPTADCGVIVGRFQVAELHPGHRDLIDRVCDRHRKVVILLGVSPVANTANNPLDFESRKSMILQVYPQVTVLYVKDTHDDALWTKAVDGIIGDILTPTQSALLYGSRDSFIKHYEGRWPTYELPAYVPEQSGTAIRAEIGRESRNSLDWRAGVIWASRNRYPTVFTTVDIAVFRPNYEQVLLGHKPGEEGWRFIGGFTDPSSYDFETDAQREVMEETGIHLRNLIFLRSFKVDDWRYAGEVDCIKTLLFAATTKEEAVAADDIDSVRWFSIDDLDPGFSPIVVPAHRRLASTAFIYALNQRNK